MTFSAYQQSLIRARAISNANQAEAGGEILFALKRAYEDLSRILDLTSTGPVTYANLAERRRQIETVIRKVSRDMNVITLLGARSTAEDTVDLYSALNKKYALGKGFKFDWKAAFSTAPTAALNNTVNRVWNDGMNFSRRVWALNDYATKSINEMVSGAVARGQSVTDLARNLRGFLMDPAMSDSLSYTMAGLKSVTGRGTVHYNAFRLAKTEINNAYRESLVIANDISPLTLGVKWNLSARHSIPDICDVWATVDGYGRGPGVYPASKTPIDHPNGNCFLTDVLRPASEWSRQKEEADFLDPSKRQVLAIFEGREMKPYQREAAWEMWQATNKLVSQRMKKAA